ncbi:MAG: hypothetical protein JW966_10445 [Anaerolineae bacterium]|nr:hypothetical protein [Anaerolineae bacterium]
MPPGRFEDYFEDRLAQIEPKLIRWAHWKYSPATEYDRDEALQNTRIILWKRYSENPEEWAPMPKEKWLAYAKGVYRYDMLGSYRNRQRKPVKNASDMKCIVND